MTKHKVADLTGAVLDTAVMQAFAKQHGLKIFVVERGHLIYSNESGDTQIDPDVFKPSVNWWDAGPIIEHERIDLRPMFEEGKFEDRWVARLQPTVYDGHYRETTGWRHTAYGPTPLVTAMRAFVLSKLGDEVDL